MADTTEKIVYKVGEQTAADLAQSLRDMRDAAKPKPPKK